MEYGDLPRSGVRLHHAIQWKSEGVAPQSARLHDSPSSESAQTQRRPPVATLPRRLRFEDETETEAEFRYLERQQQRRRTGQRGSGVLVSKPDLKLYANGNMRAGPQGAGRVVEGTQRGRMSGGQSGQETYIGSVTCSETCRAGPVARTNQVEVNGNHVTVPPQATPTTDLPINPYDPKQLPPPTQPSRSPSPGPLCHPNLSPPPVTSEMMSQIVMINSPKATKNLNQEVQSPTLASEPLEGLGGGAEVKERRVCEEDRGQDVKMKSSTTSSLSAGQSSGKSSDGQLRKPMRVELHSDDPSPPEHSITRNEPARLSLRRLFANVKLSRTRAASLDRLILRPRPSGPGQTNPEPAPSCPRKSSSLLKKTPSVQSLNVGAPLLQMRKSSSVQSLRSEQKKKKDRSADYRPAADQCLKRCVSIEDVGCPSSVRSVGRVLRVCSDGTILLEISRLNNRTFGFVISRGRGRPDSGVYVEDMVDCSTQKLYTGLLAVGDEIVEVNGEKVACLSLDQVTQLLTQTTMATIRVLRNQRTTPR
nr:uncharacterized protein KIAA1614-like [Labrus bergylta]